MTSGQPGPRGSFNSVTHPSRFDVDTGWSSNLKDTRSEICIFDNQSNSSGSTVYSEPFQVATAEGYTVYVSGTGDVTTEVTIAPAYGSWAVVSTITNAGTYSSKNPIPWVRFGLTTGTSGMTVWLYRKYSIY